MSVFRLSPLSTKPLARTVGRCAACDKPVYGEEVAVRIYGDLLHHSCAYYQSRSVGEEGTRRHAR